MDVWQDMDKIWYICVEGKSVGPCSIEDLRRDRRLTFDTFVWREGFTNWKRLSEVPELEHVFQEDESKEPTVNTDEPEDQKSAKTELSQDELALDARRGPPPYFFWIILLILVIYFLAIVQW